MAVFLACILCLPFAACGEKSGKGKIVAIEAGFNYVVGLREDGMIVGSGNPRAWSDMADWTDIAAFAIGGAHTVGLKRDGTVIATGDNSEGQCNVESWSDITAIAAHGAFTVGLKKDGTVVATGANDYGQCDVGNWVDIIAVSVSGVHTVGLKSNGTVVAVGMDRWENRRKMDEDIANKEHYRNQCNVGTWTDIVAIDAVNYKTVGLKKDGTVVSTDASDAVQDWTDITAISVADVIGGTDMKGIVYGIKKDGTVTTISQDETIIHEINAWTDIGAITAGYEMGTGIGSDSYHECVYGLKKDGKVIAAGLQSGSIYIEDWNSN